MHHFTMGSRAVAGMHREARRRLALGASALALFTASAALAQSSASADLQTTPQSPAQPDTAAHAEQVQAPLSAAGADAAQDDADHGKDIVVTGTLIRGVAPTGSNLLSVTSADIKQSGAATVRDVLGTVPQLGNFQQSVRPGLRGAEADTFQPNIRNLGPNATLTLVNGHRLIGAGTNATTADPATLPALALERAEVVADGSSALYGSDAVAGVINLITRRNFDGLETSARFGVADSYHAWDAGAVAGEKWSGGGVMVAYEFTSNSNLTGLDRPAYIRTNLTPYGGPDNRSVSCLAPNITLPGSTTTYAYPGLAANTQNKCDSAALADLLWASQRHTVFASVHQDLSSKVELWAEGSFSSRQSQGHQSPLDLSVTIPNTNPYFVPVPGSAATSETVAFRADSLLGTDHFIDHSFSRTVDVTGGVNAKLFGDWEATGYLNFGVSNTRTHESTTLNNDALNAAAAGTTLSTALDPFQGRTNPTIEQAIGNFDFYNGVRQFLRQAVVTVDGSLFKLPGGDVKVAFGSEARQEELKGNFHQGPNGAPISTNATQVERNVYSAFGELRVPIVGDDNAFSFARAISLSAAGRYDHYSDFGDTFNPKFGLDWTVVDGLTLRGSWGKSFHAPPLSDLVAIDGKVVTIGAPVGNIVLGTDPQTAGPYNVLIIAGGNPTLKPERARTYSFGADLAPRAIPKLHLNVTYYNVDYNGIIDIPPVSNAIYTNPAYASLIVRNPTAAQIAAYSVGLPSVLSVPINPAFPTTLFDLRRQNLSSRKTDGIDFEARYAIKTGLGEVQASVSGERVLSFNQQATATSAPVSQLDLALPRWRARGSLGLQRDDMTATVFVNYNGAYTDQTSLASGILTFDLPAVVTTDVYLAFRPKQSGLLSNIELSVNILNLFDTDPPIGPNGVRQDVNVIGRQAWFGIHKRF